MQFDLIPKVGQKKFFFQTKTLLKNFTNLILPPPPDEAKKIAYNVLLLLILY